MQFQLDDALKLLDKSSFSVTAGVEKFNTSKNLQLDDTKSLLERCEKALHQSAYDSKPTLRVIHHMACSGGTLISKCVAALPNVFLLSELHPTSTLHLSGNAPKFLPSDITTQARYAGVPQIDDLAWTIFRNNVQDIHRHINSFGGNLVIREHTHSDFCVGNNFQQASSVANALKSDFNLLRLVTLRNPIDSFLSLKNNNWVHFSPPNFDEYCKRICAFLSEYTDERIMRYEDFVDSPLDSLKKISDVLDLPFSKESLDVFDIFKVTGDSGRSSKDIKQRARRAVTAQESDEFNTSSYYKKIKERFDYS